jgi:hypothetical protein
MFLTVLLWIVVFVLSWFLQNCIHEGSHLYVAYWLRGWKPKEFHPYPLKRNGKWYFAYCSYETDGKKTSKWIHIAPAFAGLYWGCIWAVLCIFFYYVNMDGWVFCLIPMGMGFFDVFWFWRGYWWGSESCDGKRFRRASGL